MLRMGSTLAELCDYTKIAYYSYVVRVRHFRRSLLVTSLGCVASCGAGEGPIEPPAAPTLALTISSPRVRAIAEAAHVNWSSSNTATCSASGSWSGSRPVTGGYTFTPDAPGQFTFSLLCIGGGGEVSASVTLDAWSPLPVLPTSYANFKEVGVGTTRIPNWATHAYGDFFQNGSRALFTATMTYDRTKPIAEATGAKYEFWKWVSGAWVLDNTIFSASAATCLQPRQALTADFNGDGRPDVFVACHGYDAPPFPGERNQIVLSTGSTSYAVQDASPDVGFWHGAAAGDITGDGKVDVVVADGRRVAAFAGDGAGKFVLDSLLLDGVLPRAPFFAVQVTDVNEDGRLDIIAGGVEYTGCAGCIVAAPTTVLTRTSTGQWESVVLPAVAGEGTVLDFAVTGTGVSRAVWINRTSGAADKPSYQSRTIQRVTWPNLQSNLPYTNGTEYPLAWIVPLMIGGVLHIGSDNTSDLFTPIRVP